MTGRPQKYVVGMRYGTGTISQREGQKILIECDCGAKRFLSTNQLSAGQRACLSCKPTPAQRPPGKLRNGKGKLKSARHFLEALSTGPCTLCGTKPANNLILAPHPKPCCHDCETRLGSFDLDDMLDWAHRVTANNFA